MSANNAGKKSNQHYERLRTDIKTYANMACILEKIEQEGTLTLIANTFQQIFNREFVYTVYGRLTRAQEGQGEDSAHRYPVAADQQHVHIQG